MRSFDGGVAPGFAWEGWLSTWKPQGVIMGHGKVYANVYRTHDGVACFLVGHEFFDAVFARYSHWTPASYLWVFICLYGFGWRGSPRPCRNIPTRPWLLIDENLIFTITTGAREFRKNLTQGDSGERSQKMGWATGLEPATTRTTTESSTNWATPTIIFWS